MSLLRVCVLGSTGSIGKSTLSVIDQNRDSYQVAALTANQNDKGMFEQCLAFKPIVAAMLDEQAAERLQQALKKAGSETQVVQGADALLALATEYDIVVSAIVGAAGLLPTLAAVEAGKRVLLANKESLVMSGKLMMQAAERSGATIMPVDSEHNAIFQCMPAPGMDGPEAGIEKIILTASGGPLRKCSLDELAVVTPQQALAHPNWSMGPKISIDSATMMNKGLEVIEACHLFSVGLESIEVVVHPESVVHSMVAYSDGSVLAQMGNPDMRTPIAHALAWPRRISSGVAPLNFTRLSGLHFEEPDVDRFPCLRLAYEAQETGGAAPAVLNAANEVAVDAFLNESVSFLQLPNIIENTLNEVKNYHASDLPTIIEADSVAREVAQKLISKNTSTIPAK